MTAMTAEMIDKAEKLSEAVDILHDALCREDKAKLRYFLLPSGGRGREFSLSSLLRAQVANHLDPRVNGEEYRAARVLVWEAHQAENKKVYNAASDYTRERPIRRPGRLRQLMGALRQVWSGGGWHGELKKTPPSQKDTRWTIARRIEVLLAR